MENEFLTEGCRLWELISGIMLRYGVSETLLLGFSLILRGAETDAKDRHPHVGFLPRTALQYALFKARRLRVKYNQVAWGYPFSDFVMDKKGMNKDMPITHTMMFGGHSVMDGSRGLTGRTAKASGTLCVPPDRIEEFNIGLYKRLTAKDNMNMSYSVVERKPVDRWRFIFDIDFKVDGEGTSIATCEGAASDITFRISNWLMYAFDRPVRAWFKMGVWRVKKSNNGSFMLRNGIHIYTNVIVDKWTSEICGLLMSEQIKCPPGVIMDDIVFKDIGMRIDGCYKYVTCPEYNGKDDIHPCELCFMKKAIAVAPPYDIGRNYDEWRACLLTPLPDEGVWELNEKTKEIGQYDSRKRQKTIDAIKENAAEHTGRSPLTESITGLRKDSLMPVEQTRKERIIDMIHSEYPQLGRPTRVDENSSGMIFVSTKCRKCPFKGGDHSSSTMYLFIENNPPRMRLRCRHRDFPGDKYPCGKFPRAEKYLKMSDALVDVIWPDRVKYVEFDEIAKAMNLY